MAHSSSTAFLDVSRTLEDKVEAAKQCERKNYLAVVGLRVVPSKQRLAIDQILGARSLRFFAICGLSD